MSFIIVGTDHRHSPVRLREQIFFSRNRLRHALNFMEETGAIKAGVVLSTCNRVEIYASVDTAEIGVDGIKSFISGYCEISQKDISPYLYIYSDMDAVKHLFRVTSGLDSLILGESQILGQVRAAFYESEKNHFLDHSLREIFNSAVSSAVRIHRETGISKGKVSIGSVAMDFIRKKIDSFYDKNILIVGVGKVTELVLKYLKEEESNVIFISNRTFEKARSLADQIGAKAVRFDNLKECLKKADIVITATKSPHFIINKETIGETVSQKRLLIVDLAMPRDVDPRVAEIDGVELFDSENLGSVIRENRDRKRLEVRKAEQIMEFEVRRLWERLSRLEQEQVALR